MSSRRRRTEEDLDEDRRKVREAFRQLGPDELRALRGFYQAQLERYEAAKESGKPKSLKQVRKELMAELPDAQALGANELTTRTVPRWLRMELIPGERLRPNAHKMMLRPEEEAQLPLDRMGRGALVTPRKLLGNVLPPRREFAWGIFAHPNSVERVLGPRWAQRPAEEVLPDERFYFDALRRAHAMELTLLLHASRPLPLAGAQEMLEQRLRAGMERLKGGAVSEKDSTDLKRFVRQFDERRLQRYGLVQRGAVAEGTHFVLAVTPEGELVADALTPDPLRDRKGHRIGGSRNPLVTGAVFEAFLGLDPLDRRGKLSVGRGLLWNANGLRVTLGQNPNQYRAVVGPDGQVHFPPPEVVERLDPAAGIFRLAEAKVRMLLGGIRRAQRQSPAGDEGSMALQP